MKSALVIRANHNRGVKVVNFFPVFPAEHESALFTGTKRAGKTRGKTKTPGKKSRQTNWEVL